MQGIFAGQICRTYLKIGEWDLFFGFRLEDGEKGVQNFCSSTNMSLSFKCKTDLGFLHNE